MVEIRDPLHGAIAVHADEAPVVDHPFIQRLRGIKQMGFSELPFPGAVHTRYAHSLGVMHLAGLAFDSVFRNDPFSSPARRAALRSAVRLAALCHDLGHAPFSHCTEFAMPPLSALGLDAYAPKAVAGRLNRHATHEDYTILILTRSSLNEVICRQFPFTGRHVAALVSRELSPGDDFFHDGGNDYRRILSQLISSELDADRLDYLGRDSYYSGARYGQIDTHWMLSNLEWHADDTGQVSLAIDQRSVYAFDDFMIARYHMFLMVYFHHKSIVYEEMLRRHFTGSQCTYEFPADAEAYLGTDDIHLYAYLRQSGDTMARRIAHRVPYRRVIEKHGSPSEVSLDAAEAALKAAGIDRLVAASTSRLSGYYALGRKRVEAPPIYVIERQPGGRRRVSLLQDATRVFERYRDERHISRIYVAEDDLPAARALVEAAGG